MITKVICRQFILTYCQTFNILQKKLTYRKIQQISAGYHTVSDRNLGNLLTNLTILKINRVFPCNNVQKYWYCQSASENPCSKKQCENEPKQWPSGNRTTYKFHPEIETALNAQINAEFKAFYYYLSMASYFGRVDVALLGCESFFSQMHQEEYSHAVKLINYVKMRGGLVSLCPIEAPPDQDWKCPLHALKVALQMETEVAEKLEVVNACSHKHADLSTNDFITTHFITEQMKGINEIAKLITVLSGIGDHALARFIFDRYLHDNFKSITVHN